MQNKYQDQFGYPIPRTAGKVRPFMAERIQEFIRRSSFCVMATSNSQGDCDASPKGGMPGFVKVLNDATVHSRRCRQQTFPRLWQCRNQPQGWFDFSHSRPQPNGAGEWQSQGDRWLRVRRCEIGSAQSRRKGGGSPGLATRCRRILQPLPQSAQVLQALGRRGNLEKYYESTTATERARDLAKDRGTFPSRSAISKRQSHC